jgi:hypothetical protein
MIGKKAHSKKPEHAPKLIPTFGLLIAGSDVPELPDNEITVEAIYQRLLGLARSIFFILQAQVEDTSVVYGEHAGKQTVTRILTGNATMPGTLATRIAKTLSYPLQRVDCANGTSIFPIELSDTEHAVMLCHVDPNDTYLSQARIIQEDTLRVFSDILIWVSHPSRTSLGNNKDFRLLRNAILEGKPVIWIHKDASASILDYKRLDEPHRLLLLTSENSEQAIRSLFVDFEESLLLNELQFIANPITTHLGKLARDSMERKLYSYFTTKRPSTSVEFFSGQIDRILSALILLKGLIPAFFPKNKALWYGVDVPETLSEAAQHITEPKGLKQRFEWSDRLANVASGLRRDITWSLYLLSTIAVFTAVAGAIGAWPGHIDWFWPVIELLTICTMLICFSMASHLDLLGNWMFHRFLAEQIRYVRMGYPFLTFQAPLFAVTRYIDYVDNGQIQIRLQNPETWLLKRTLIGAGLPYLLDSRTTYQPDNFCNELRDYVIGVINNQLSYHQKNHKSLHTLEQRLHTLTTLAFVLTALAVIGHFIIHAQWLLIFTAALPSLAAAIHGIVTMNEMGRVSRLSQQTNNQLKHLLESISRLDFKSPEHAMTWIQLRSITHQSASVMSDVNSQWQTLIRDQKTALPA